MCFKGMCRFLKVKSQTRLEVMLWIIISYGLGWVIGFAT